MQTEVNDLQAEVTRLRAIAQSYGAQNHELQMVKALSKTNESQTKAGLKNMMAQILHLNTKIAS